jgi:hypothetical protein
MNSSITLTHVAVIDISSVIYMPVVVGIEVSTIMCWESWHQLNSYLAVKFYKIVL